MKQWMLNLFALFWLVAFLWAAYFRDYDDSDDAEKGIRSGMMIHVDHKTGCEYFSTIFGGPTPRLDRDGKQICR